MFEEKITYLNKLQKLSHSPSLEIESYQDTLTHSFFSALLSDLEFAETPGEKAKIQKEIDAHTDLAVVTYRRNTLWEKITRSKKNPEFKYIKGKKEIFDALLNRSEHIRNRFGSHLDLLIKQEQGLITIQKETNRKNNYHLRKPPSFNMIYDKDGDYIPDRLALVHTTRYKPQKDETGQYMLESLATATDLKHPRNTLHFSIGHHVESHLAGAWDDTPYVIIAPMKETMDTHGKPLGISSVDTFFEVGLNENMHLPKTTHLIEPSNKKLPEGIFSVTQGNRTIYKQNGFTEKEKAFLGIKEPLSDKQIASLVKKKVTKDMISRLGYVQADFERVDETTAQKIQNMGEKLGIKSSAGSALHSCIALSGFNRLGQGINNVYALLNEIEEINNGKEVSSSEKNIIFDKLSKMRSLDSYLKPFDLKPQLGFTEKELQVYEAWKKKAQQKISILLKQHAHSDHATALNLRAQNRAYR